MSRFPHRWVLVAAIVCDRQASGVSPLVFEAICRMISCLENSIFIGSGISRDMTVVSPRSIFEAKANNGVSGMP